MHWQILIISLFLAVFLAFLFVKFILWMGLQDQLNLVIPLLPIFYALVFPVLEKNYSKRESKATSYLFPPLPKNWWSGKLTVILIGTLASLLVQMELELSAWITHHCLVLGQPWPGPSSLTLSKIIRLIQGDLIRFSGPWQVAFLAMEMLIVSILGGFCVGLLARTNPLLHGLITGVIVSIWMGANQFIPLYETFSNLSWTVGQLLGFEWHNGLLVGLFLQVFLFALFSGLGFRSKSS